jgi:hypothetical protein
MRWPGSQGNQDGTEIAFGTAGKSVSSLLVGTIQIRNRHNWKHVSLLVWQSSVQTSILPNQFPENYLSESINTIIKIQSRTIAFFTKILCWSASRDVSNRRPEHRSENILHRNPSQYKPWVSL